MSASNDIETKRAVFRAVMSEPHKMDAIARAISRHAFRLGLASSHPEAVAVARDALHRVCERILTDDEFVDTYHPNKSEPESTMARFTKWKMNDLAQMERGKVRVKERFRQQMNTADRCQNPPRLSLNFDRILRVLSAGERELLLALYREDLSATEISKRTGESANTLYSRHARSLSKLREHPIIKKHFGILDS
jgi:DNA-directed RNA polymerase specialized sigma24 family protein